MAAVDGVRDDSAAYECLLDEYEMDPGSLPDDLAKLIEELVSHALLELSDA